MREQHDKYTDPSLVGEGVHSLEFEKNLDNVMDATASLGVTRPVAIATVFPLAEPTRIVVVNWDQAIDQAHSA